MFDVDQLHRRAWRLLRPRWLLRRALGNRMRGWPWPGLRGANVWTGRGGARRRAWFWHQDFFFGGDDGRTPGFGSVLLASVFRVGLGRDGAGGDFGAGLSLFGASDHREIAIGYGLIEFEAE